MYLAKLMQPTHKTARLIDPTIMLAKYFLIFCFSAVDALSLYGYRFYHDG
jgi:hypothetical protein